MFGIYHIPPPSTLISDEENRVLRQWRHEALCEHKFEIRKKMRSNGTAVFMDQCKYCGWKGEGYKKTELSEAEQQAAPEFDTSATYAYSERCNTARQIEKAIQDERRAAWWEWYNEYLQSPEWQQKRRLVLARAQGVCEACRLEVATQVHHLVYYHVGAEPLFELVAICEPCHKAITEKAAP